MASPFPGFNSSQCCRSDAEPVLLCVAGFRAETPLLKLLSPVELLQVCESHQPELPRDGGDCDSGAGTGYFRLAVGNSSPAAVGGDSSPESER